MITKPTLLLDEEKCRRNIRSMAQKAKDNGLLFRPHFKTHQSREIGRWFKEEDVDAITVSSFEMARYFSPEWQDITVAFPVNILEINTINELARNVKLNLLIESPDVARFLLENLKHEVGFFFKIDVGTHRTGILPENTEVIDEVLVITKDQPLLNFKGFLAHAGHTYACRSKAEIQQVFDESVAIMDRLRSRYRTAYPGLVISVGDTPGCSVVTDFSEVDEIRPGNFVFYDLMQVQIGATDFEHIAVAMACPVVAVHESRSEIVVFGVGVHFAKDSVQDDSLGTIYGRVVEPDGNGWGKVIPGAYVRSLSQEHGIVVVPREVISKYKVGDLLLILPVHSCMTVDLMKGYLTTDGKWVEAK